MKTAMLFRNPPDEQEASGLIYKALVTFLACLPVATKRKS